MKSLRALKLASAPAGEVVVYQIGDLFDLWRQVDGLDPNANAASAIQNDHASLLVALRDPDLNAQFLLGNHDYDLFRFPNFDAWQRSYVLAPSVMLLHGDVFDWVEQLPDELQNLVLFLFTSNPAGTADLEKLRPLNNRQRAGKNFHDFIQNRVPAPTGKWREAADDDGGSWNVQVDGTAPKEMLLYLDAGTAEMRCGQSPVRQRAECGGDRAHAPRADRGTRCGGRILRADGLRRVDRELQYGGRPHAAAECADRGAGSERGADLSVVAAGV